MPTIIALDVSLSMQRNVPGRTDDNALSYYQLAVKGINQFLEHLGNNSKLELVSYVTFSKEFEIRVDFTRDYDQIRHAVKKQVHFDCTSLEIMLTGVNNIISSNSVTQNPWQVVVFTDCGIGFGSKSILTTIRGLKTDQTNFPWCNGLSSTKLNFICMGLKSEYYFLKAVYMYEKFFEVTGLNGVIFQPNSNDQLLLEECRSQSIRRSELGRTVMHEMIELLCGRSYTQFETILKCGGYFRWECPIILWPSPTLYDQNCKLSLSNVSSISNVRICGYISLSDIGSPTSFSRHLIIPKFDRERQSRRGLEKFSRNTSELSSLTKLESELRAFILNADGSEDNCSGYLQSENENDSICVLLHGALKIENMAALVLLSNNWFGFIYTFSDTKKKSNLLLSLLPPGNNVVPWMGDLRMFGLVDDFFIGESSCFPVKSEKRSYSQNLVIWIKQYSLQSDLQKVIRHAKKIPEKTAHFYKELNRIRRAALSIGFFELIEILASVFEKEAFTLPSTANPECNLQLKHSAIELRTAKSDLKNLIYPLTNDPNL